MQRPVRHRRERTRAWLRLLARTLNRARAEIEGPPGLSFILLAAAVLGNAWLATATHAAVSRGAPPPAMLLVLAAPILGLAPAIAVVLRQSAGATAVSLRAPWAALLVGTLWLARLPLALLPWAVIACRCGWIGWRDALLVGCEPIALLALVLVVGHAVARALGAHAGQNPWSRAALPVVALLSGVGLLWLRAGGGLLAGLAVRLGWELAAVALLSFLLSATLRSGGRHGPWRATQRG